MKQKKNVSCTLGFLAISIIGGIIIPPLIRKYSIKLYRLSNKKHDNNEIIEPIQVKKDNNNQKEG